jgi:phage terminase large subunit-like protein
MSKIEELVEHWRSVGPITWAEGPYGWTGLDKEPITLSPWQKAVLTAWHDNQDVTTLGISNIKKTGKTLLNSVLLAWRWITLPGEHFCVGNDLDQSSSRQFQEITAMVRRNPYLKRHVKIGNKKLEFTPTNSTIVALACDSAGNAGANHLTASHTEAWGIVYEAGIRSFEELTSPPGLFYGLPCLRICDSYAGYEGESETWHRLVDRGLNGERISKDWGLYREGGLLLFHAEGQHAQNNCFRGTDTEADTYYLEQRSLLRPAAYKRLHENIRSTGSESFISMDKWDACIDPDLRPALPNSELNLYVGVDASLKHDTSAVVAVYVNDDNRVCLAKHRIWTPSKGQVLDLDATIGDFLRELHEGFSVTGVYYDPWQMADLSMRLQRDGLLMQEYPQSSPNLTAMSQNLFELIEHNSISLYASSQLRKHAIHATAVESTRGWRISKQKAANKIDGIVALAMATLQAVQNRDTGPMIIAAF